MVNFKKLADQAKSVVDKRGGVDALKADAEQLRGIAKGGEASPTRPRQPLRR